MGLCGRVGGLGSRREEEEEEEEKSQQRRVCLHEGVFEEQGDCAEKGWFGILLSLYVLRPLCVKGRYMYVSEGPD